MHFTEFLWEISVKTILLQGTFLAKGGIRAYNMLMGFVIISKESMPSKAAEGDYYDEKTTCIGNY